MVFLAAVFATYVHDLNPVIWKITDAIQLRWYGLAYLLGFIAGYLLLKRLAEKRLFVLKPELIGDFIGALALFGVFIGGRLGYILLYQIPDAGWERLMADPWILIRVWEGGMASHGGILGVAVFTWFYAKKHQVTWTGLGDGISVVAPIGLFCGRIANFINGELYGRVADGVAWSVKFPLSLERCPREVQDAAWQACLAVDPKLSHATSLKDLVTASRENPKVEQALANFLPTRHPSQLYEAFLEGSFLFGVLWWVRVKFPKAPDGLITAMFFTIYPLVRILSEQFREPDAAMMWVFTKGQFFSLFMFIFAGAFYVYAWRGWNRIQQQKAE